MTDRAEGDERERNNIVHYNDIPVGNFACRLESESKVDERRPATRNLTNAISEILHICNQRDRRDTL